MDMPCYCAEPPPLMKIKKLPFSPAEELRTRLLEVVNTCPVEQCNPADCPLYRLREWDLSRRLRWLNALNRADLEYLAAYHHVCQLAKAMA